MPPKPSFIKRNRSSLTSEIAIPFLLRRFLTPLKRKKYEIAKIDILKIDIEGKEHDALISMGKYLEEKIAKYIKIEMNFNDKQNFTSVNQLLNDAGYYLIGFSNMKYYENKLLFVDAYYTC